jgi:hypothetical protein
METLHMFMSGLQLSYLSTQVHRRIAQASQKYKQVKPAGTDSYTAVCLVMAMAEATTPMSSQVCIWAQHTRPIPSAVP